MQLEEQAANVEEQREEEIDHGEVHEGGVDGEGDAQEERAGLLRLREGRRRP